MLTFRALSLRQSECWFGTYSVLELKRIVFCLFYSDSRMNRIQFTQSKSNWVLLERFQVNGINRIAFFRELMYSVIHEPK